MPWKPAQLKGTLNDTSSLGPDSTVYFRINELGRLMSEDDDMCSTGATGEEFNPLIEKDYYGRVVPYQDPSRGRIESCVIEDTGNVDANSGAPIEVCNIGADA